MKGIIIAAGYGSRFLPVTKTIPKEMLPLIDKPAIDFIIEEFVASGITDILIVSSRRKKSLEDYFDREIELEETFIKEHAESKLDKIKPVKANIYFIRQKEMRGTGDAVLLGKEFLTTPFVLAYPDDLIFSTTPLAKQLMTVYQETHKNVLAVLDCKGEELSRYGVVEPTDPHDQSKTVSIKGMIEKPPSGTEPSSLVSMGRYLLTPDIFPILEQGLNECQQKEYYLTEALNILARQGKMVAHQFSGKRYDTGEPLGYLKTLTEYALTRDDIKDEYLHFLKKII